MTDLVINKFIETWLDFDLQLREKQGLNQDLLEKLFQLLNQIRLDLEGERQIPKKLAEIFLDMWGAMTSCAAMYEGDMPEAITTAADHLTSSAREICTN